MKRPYPWKCRTCRERQVNPVVMDYTADMEHDGRAYTVTVKNLKVLRCSGCGAQMLPDESYAKLTDALRQAAGLLMPVEITSKRQGLGLSQKALADYLRVAPETVNRWERGGQIQQRSMDLLLRAFFDVPALRRYLVSGPPVSTVSVTEMPPSTQLAGWTEWVVPPSVPASGVSWGDNPDRPAVARAKALV